MMMGGRSAVATDAAKKSPLSAAPAIEAIPDVLIVVELTCVCTDYRITIKKKGTQMSKNKRLEETKVFSPEDQTQTTV